MRWLAELQRRNVIRIGGVYVVGAWLVVQVADTLLPIFHTPDWVLQALVVLLALGFIPALVFAWIFELTPEGLRRDRGADAAGPVAVDLTARRLDLAVILLLLATIGVVIWDRGRAPAPPAVTAPAEEATAAAAALGPHSIAVLPFANFSTAPEDALFADGLADTLLHHLAQQRQLKVIARNSSFAYRDKEVDLRQVGRELGVASVLEGSVQRQGERVRVIAQLIETRDGSHLWSQTYDRPLADLFAIQDEIGAAVLKALRVELLGDEPAQGDSGSSHPQALALYLQANEARTAVDRIPSEDQLAKARELLRQALRLDPGYVEGWILLARVQNNLAFLQRGAARAEAIELSYAALRQAILLKPDSTEAPGVLAWHLFREQRGAESLAISLSLLERTPNDTALMRLAGLTLISMRRPADALVWQRRAQALDPHSSSGERQIGLSLMGLGRQQEAREHYRKAIESFPRFFLLYDDLARLEMNGAGRWPEGVEWLLRGMEVAPMAGFAGSLAGASARLGLHARAADWVERHAKLSAGSEAALRAGIARFEGDPAEVLQLLRASREAGDDDWEAEQRGWLAMSCWQAGDLECAQAALAAGLAELDSGVEGIAQFDDADDHQRAALLGFVALRLGDAQGEPLLRTVLASLRQLPMDSVGQSLDRPLPEAELLAVLGDEEGALAALEAALPADGESVRLRTIAGTTPDRSPFFEGLEGHPRFRKAMAELERRRARMAARVEVLLKAYADSGR